MQKDSALNSGIFGWKARKALLLLLFTFSYVTSYCEVNYFNYHNDINKAESLFFVRNKPKESFAVYDRILANYKFVFVDDYFLAAQIACKYNDTQRVYKYLTACFKNGLNLYQLSLSPLLAVYADTAKNGKIHSLYDTCRREYLSRIDLDYRAKVYQIYSEDQNDKELTPAKFYERLAAHIEELIGYIKAKGFPSDRLIGIDDSTIKVKGRNLKQWYKKVCLDNRVRVDEHHGNGEDQSLSSCTILFMLVHHPCSYQQLEPYLMDEIKKGNLHPRDAGLLFDNPSRMVNLFRGQRISCQPLDKHYYKLINGFRTYPEKWRDDIPQIDSLRKTLSIASIAQDSIKKSKCQLYQFYNNFGVWGCR